MQEAFKHAFSEFLVAEGQHYGYCGRIREIENDFSRLRGAVYLDHAGAVPYSDSLLRDVFENLKASVLPNPHSSMGASDTRVEVYEEARLLTLELCQAPSNEYDIIFTSGATQALKLVGEAFPWSPSSVFAYTRDNHNSVLGIRPLALEAGAAVLPVDVEQHTQGGWHFPSCGPILCRSAEQCGLLPSSGPCLFAFPQESNFNGERYDAGIIDHVQSWGLAMSGASQAHCPEVKKWFVLLDAAKACATRPPNLGRHPADFVALSFYKIFGYPTGLGALVVRKSAMKVLKHGYYGGGTLEAVAAESDFAKRRPGSAAWEHGTPNFIAIASLRYGFKRLASLGGFPAIDLHTTSLATWLTQKLADLKHANKQPVCHLYGASKPKMGPTIALNILHDDGSWVGYKEVERFALLNKIHIRTGCFCNPGACSQALGLNPQSIIGNYAAGHICGDDHDLVNGVPTGVIRLSIGYSTTFEEVYKFVNFITAYFMKPEAEIGTVDVSPSEAALVAERVLGAAVEERESVSPIAEGTSTFPLQQAIAEFAGGHGTKQRSNARAGSCPSCMGNASTGKSSGSSSSEGNPRLPVCTQAQPAAKGKWPVSCRVGCDATESPCIRGRLEKLFIYPVKSCGAQQVQSWPVGPGGLRFDRHWALLDGHGRIMTLKSHPRLVMIRPQVSLEARTLTLWSCEEDVEPVSLPITANPDLMDVDPSWCEARAPNSGPTVPVCTDAQALRIRLCGKTVLCDQLQGECVDDKELCLWLRRVLSVDCTLVCLHRPQTGGVEPAANHSPSVGTPGPSCAHSLPGDPTHAPNTRAIAVPEAQRHNLHRHDPSEIRSSFANDGGMLMVSTASLDDLASRLSTGTQCVDPLRFRANLVVRPPSYAPFEEDGWREFAIGPCRFVVRKRCSRCDVIRVDHETGTKGSVEPLLALAQYRRYRGSIHFGVICDVAPGGGVVWLKAGDGLTFEHPG